MGATRIGIAGPVFGTGTQSWGIIENEEKTTEVQESKLTDGDGDIIAVDQYSKEILVSFEYTYRDTGGPDETAVGSGNTIASPETATDIYVRSATETRPKAPGYKTLRIEGSSWPEMS